LLVFPGERKWAIEVTRSLTPTIRRGFHEACNDLQSERQFVVYAGVERYPVNARTEAIGLAELASMVAGAAGEAREAGEAMVAGEAAG
jgi:hypothetical protein